MIRTLIVALLLTSVLVAPAIAQEKTEPPAQKQPSWTWVALSEGVELSYAGEWKLVFVKNEDALVRPSRLSKELDFVQVQSADAAPGISDVTALEAALRARIESAGLKAEFVQGKRGRHATLEVRSQQQVGARRVSSRSLFAVIGKRIVEVRATVESNLLTKKSVDQVLASVRFRPPSKPWVAVNLDKSTRLRFPGLPKRVGNMHIYEEDGFVLTAILEPQQTPLAGPKQAFALLAKEIEGLRPALEKALFEVKGDKALPPSIHPQAMGFRFDVTREGKAGVVFTLSKVSSTATVRLMAYFDPKTPGALARARDYLHQLRPVLVR